MELNCNICNKNYASYKSLWNHNKKFHKSIDSENVSSISHEVAITSPEVVIKIYDNRTCKFCNKQLCDRKYRWRHEQKCKIIFNKNKDEEIIKIKKETEDKDKIKDEEIIKIKKEMTELKIMVQKLQKSMKIHPKTLNKINNQLNNNGTINNINIIQLGHEDLSNVLNEEQKMSILDRQAMSINHLVNLVHVSGKYKKFKNVYITNLQSTFAYKFDERQNKFIAVNKNELLTDIVDSRMYDIQKFYEDVYDQLEPRKAKQIKMFINRMENNEDELKHIKKEEIKLILYNNRDKILPSEEKNSIIIKDTDKPIIKKSITI